ncbi:MULTISPECIES: DNA cytosine methyltransferase [unclassified Imperialibacter]|uniref:DNA cytosine methyltransferase n=1 Tax=unclassified Imperialibacter TaxID=2629706 RepID=UPI001256A866|nr:MULTISPECIES: DNA cytosine methyltransferase [unclassified Imperialibacter]CAD5289499.1 Modification methylase SinI [Imperialibacter sp. 89]CAD5289734.1 Modification methylase SinI [Imperialibacter sp. 75]VVT34573.1 Modification methylase SinI [Imperialibacter sp. EC-SDR9]
MKGTKITIQDAADELNLTPQQVRNLCRDQKIYSQKVGKTWILEEEQVVFYKANNNCGLTKDKEVSSDQDASGIEFKRPIALSFFTGAMGLDLGIEKAGFKTLLACETDNACRKTIVRNRPEIALISDIRNYTADQIREKAGLSASDEIDLVVGGPPCQAFSTAGKRKGFEDDRGNVFLTFLDRIIELKPKYAVIENVRGILSAALKHRPHEKRGLGNPPLNVEEVNGGALMHIVKVLNNEGYGVSFNLYNAANFGTPQKRERVIIVASRDGGKLPYLTPSNSEKGEFGLPFWNTFEDAVRDLPKQNMHYVKFPEKRLRYYRMLTSGQYWKHLPEDIQKEALGQSYYSGGGKTGFLRRLAWDQPAPTLVTHPAMPATDLAHPEEDRPLSIEEYKRVQQFPDGWKIEGSLIEQYRQIGNAVPVGLGKAVGDLIMNHIRGVKIAGFADFKYSRYRNTDDKAWLSDMSRELGQFKIAI